MYSKRPIERTMKGRMTSIEHADVESGQDLEPTLEVLPSFEAPSYAEDLPPEVDISQALSPRHSMAEGLARTRRLFARFNSSRRDRAVTGR